MTDEQLRSQDRAYIAAVYAAHPELRDPVAEQILSQDLRAAHPEPQAQTELEITEELLERVLAALKAETRPRWRSMARTIIKAVGMKHGYSVKELLGNSRTKLIAEARQEAYYLVRYHTKLSLPQIAQMFNRDHSTVLYGIKRHGERIGCDMFGRLVKRRAA